MREYHCYTGQSDRAHAPCPASQAQPIKTLPARVGIAPAQGGIRRGVSIPFVIFPNACAACNRNPSTVRLGHFVDYPPTYGRRERVFLYRYQMISSLGNEYSLN